MAKTRQAVLETLQTYLAQLSRACDAEHLGYFEEAQALRDENLASLTQLLAAEPWLNTTLPGLAESVRSLAILDEGWATYYRQVKALLAP